MVKKILSLSERGTELSNAATREIVEKNLSKFFENPKSHTTEEFNKALRELEAVITPEQAKQVREAFSEASKGIDANVKHTKPTKSKAQTLTEKYGDKKPEDIMNLMNSRSGIKQVREDFPKASFDRLSQQKMRSVLRGGNIESTVSGDDLYKFLNNEKNYELFSEFLGESQTENLRLTAKEIGKKQIKSEYRKKAFSDAAHKLGSYKILELFFGIF